jgi:DMSO/TMAO reductase YedYZ molybdopterin-dependent catalytic subunit
MDPLRHPEQEDDGDSQERRQKLGVGQRLSSLRSGYQRGIAAAVPAVVVGSVVAIAIAEPSPLEAPAEWLMEWTPVPIASFLLLHAGTLANPAARLGALAVLLLFGGIANVMTAPIGRIGPRALVAALLFAGLPVAMFGAHLDVVLVLVAGAYALALLGISTQSRAPEDRRDFLIRTGAVLGAAAVLLALPAVESLVSAAAVRRLFPFRPPPGMAVPGLATDVTPAAEFYVMDKTLDDPSLSVDAWYLGVSGHVSRSLHLGLHSLTTYPVHHRYVTLECVDNPVGGPLMGNALWTGVRVSDVLRQAGANGKSVVFEAADDYAESLPVAVIHRIDPLIAFGMNGETLSRSHGYPVRLVAPGLYGFKSVKWLTGLRVTDVDTPGGWAAHGWNEMPQIHTTARIDVARRSGQSILLAGVAFAGIRGVHSVQIRVNGGPWRTVHVAPALARTAWVQWVARFRQPGRCTVEARAVDGLGRIQAGLPHGAYPAGATGWHSVTL